MKSIYNIIKEGLMDDDDVLLRKTDKALAGDWLKANTKGTFTIKDKKSILGCTIVGDVIFDGYEGEDIPVSCWTVKGNVYFVNCPNLKTIDGFISGKTSIDGGLYIENCPSLESLKGCPKLVNYFSCIGNRKIKSLEGAPEHVFGNCYIMKNGKKFTEEQIRKAIEVTNRVDCSEEEELATINEALIEPHLLKLADYLKDSSLKFKRLFASYGFTAWDKVTSKDVIVYTWPNINEKAIKDCRVIISGKADGFIILMDKEGNYTYTISSSKQLTNIKKGSYNFGSTYYRVPSTELVNDCKNAHEIIIIKTARLSAWDKVNDRKNAKDGMIYNTDRQNAEIAKSNVERYKKIVAKMKAERDTEYIKLDEQVQDIVMRVLKASQMAHRDPNKFGVYTISELNDLLYDETRYDRGRSYGRTGLLRIYYTYTRYFTEVKKGNAESYYRDYLKKSETSLKEKIKEVDGKLKNLGL